MSLLSCFHAASDASICLSHRMHIGLKSLSPHKTQPEQQPLVGCVHKPHATQSSFCSPDPHPLNLACCTCGWPHRTNNTAPTAPANNASTSGLRGCRYSCRLLLYLGGGGGARRAVEGVEGMPLGVPPGLAGAAGARRAGACPDRDVRAKPVPSTRPCSNDRETAQQTTDGEFVWKPDRTPRR